MPGLPGKRRDRLFLSVDGQEIAPSLGDPVVGRSAVQCQVAAAVVLGRCWRGNPLVTRRLYYSVTMQVAWS